MSDSNPPEAIEDKLKQILDRDIPDTDEQEQALINDLMAIITTETIKAKEAVKAILPDKIDLSKYEPGEDGGISINVDSDASIEHLCRFTSDQGYNEAIDEMHKRLNNV